MLRQGNKTMDSESFIPMKKTQSLDWSPATVVQKKHHQKTVDAKAYRQQMLEQVNRDRKQHKAIVEKEINTKATFAQCVFNMSNSLMVSTFIYAYVNNQR
jgi:hypothetical protein